MFYQDFNEQFEGYTQLRFDSFWLNYVVLSGFQWTIWRIYTTCVCFSIKFTRLFYQDFNEQFEGYTQHRLLENLFLCSCFIRISMNNLKDIHNIGSAANTLGEVVLSGFQWTIWRIYTTCAPLTPCFPGCFIRISMNNLKDIHNQANLDSRCRQVVLSGFQWTIWRIYTTILHHV